MSHLLDTLYAKCEQVTLVSDNLNTHTMGALYEAFSPEQARACVMRLNLVHTPTRQLVKHRRVRTELPTSQCLAGRRIGCLKFRQSEIATWSLKTNAKQRGGDWRFQLEDAQTKLNKLYPKL